MNKLELAIAGSNAKLTRMVRRSTSLFALVTSLVLAAGCSTSLFKVKPATELPPLPSTSRSVDGGAISIRVAPLLTDDDTQELFEANLPIAGVLAVRLELNFQSGTPIEMKSAHFRVRDNQNREWKLLSPKQAVSRIMKANGMTLYNPNFKKQFENDFGTYGLDIKTPLDSANRTRQGFLFFQTPDKQAVDSSYQLTLVVERLPQPVSILLN